MRQTLTRAFAAAVFAGAALALTPQADAQLLNAERLAVGLDRPLFITHAPGDFDRVFIVEQDGAIRIIQNDTLLPGDFLNIDPIVGSAGTEQGLFSLAFHPDYQDNGLFYVSYTNNSGDNVIREYSVSSDPNVADASSGRMILNSIEQPFSNHNGGWIGFGPDGYLYFAVGDGGFANDPERNGQDRDTLLGAMLRIDVDGDDFPSSSNLNYAIPADNPFVGTTGADEIWAWGLRNPWRNSFDRLTGDFYMADVGQNAREEVNIQSATSIGGENYGWRCMEGFNCTNLSGCVCGSAALTMPALDYDRSGGRCSITGGYVYRGVMIPEIQGLYFYADYCSADIYTAEPDVRGNALNNVINRRFDIDIPGSINVSWVASFGEDAYGELYIADLFGGEIFRIIPEDPTPRVDCDSNGIEDAREILDGSGDADGNGVLDACEVTLCTADLDGNGLVDLDDFSILASQFGNAATDCANGCSSDFDGDNDVDLDDFSIFASQFGNVSEDC